MKKVWFFLILMGFSAVSFAQVQDHTQESYTTSAAEVKVGLEIDLIFQVTIDNKWYIYSTEFPADGPVKTAFTFTPHASYQLVGKPKAINPKKKYEEIWEGDIAYHEKKAEFRQTVKILQTNPKIAGSYEFQTCSTIDGLCLPPETVEFDFKIKTTSNAEKKAEPKNEGKTPKEEAENEEKTENNEDTATSASKQIEKTEPPKEDKKEKILPVKAEKEQESMLGFMLLAFGAGLLALLTPCVFPMIPMTVTFFTKDRKKKTDGLSAAEIKAIERKFRQEALRKAFFYGFSIIAIYTLLGTAVAWINGPEFANWLSTHWAPNLFFFAISILFGLSFLGMFELVLPNSWVNKADQQADKGGYYGVFFMAFTLALVSFSCTGPIVGSILVQSAGGAILKPVLGMFAFSLAIALPFTLFAVFPTWLNSLPKSGGWLNNVKVVLGFLEIALAFKFLSIPDQTYHWGYLNRDVFLALWITIFGMIGFYLMGAFRMPHDSPSDKVSVHKAMLAMLSFAFVIYMIPGLFGAPLTPLAGYLPPRHTMDFDLNNATPRTESQLAQVKYGDLFELPHGLSGFFDLEEGLKYARQINKPIFIDFTGHGCVNCREMEERVWVKPEVLKRLREDFVVVALYVDDKTQLPENEWITSKYDKKIKKTIGAKNADIQISKFNNNAQPYYCLLDNEGNLLIEPKAYDLNPDNFVKFLDTGKARFQKGQIATR
jgi:thiol:disulfide interchange protein DsbD